MLKFIEKLVRFFLYPTIWISGNLLCIVVSRSIISILTAWTNNEIVTGFSIIIYFGILYCNYELGKGWWHLTNSILKDYSLFRNPIISIVIVIISSFIISVSLDFLFDLVTLVPKLNTFGYVEIFIPLVILGLVGNFVVRKELMKIK